MQQAEDDDTKGLATFEVQRDDMLKRLVKFTEMAAHGKVAEMGIVALLRDNIISSRQKAFVTGTCQNDTLYTFALTFLNAAQPCCDNALCLRNISIATARSALESLGDISETRLSHEAMETGASRH